MNKAKEVLERVERFKKEMEGLGIDVKVTITVDLRRRHESAGSH